MLEWELPPGIGLQILKDLCTQKSCMGRYSLVLTENLDFVIQATRDAAHIRNQGFNLDRPITEAIHDRSVERRLEAAMLHRWNRPEMWHIPGGWERLVAFQVPLFAQQQREQWGCIDLLGMNSLGLPVVVELKKHSNAHEDGRTEGSETPLRMVLEAAAYAVALQENWRLFRPEWIARLTALDVPDQVIRGVPDQSLQTVPIVAAAPASFWIDWLPVTTKGATVTRETWESFRSLLTAFRSAGLPTSFVSVSGNELDAEGLAVQPLIGFPPIQ